MRVRESFLPVLYEIADSNNSQQIPQTISDLRDVNSYSLLASLKVFSVDDTYTLGSIVHCSETYVTSFAQVKTSCP